MKSIALKAADLEFIQINKDSNNFTDAFSMYRFFIDLSIKKFHWMIMVSDVKLCQTKTSYNLTFHVGVVLHRKKN